MNIWLMSSLYSFWYLWLARLDDIAYENISEIMRGLLRLCLWQFERLFGGLRGWIPY